FGTGSPTSVMVPALGSLKPRQHRSVVVLPAPLGPSRPKHSPRRIAKSRPCRTSLLPYDLRKPLTESTTPSAAFIAVPPRLRPRWPTHLPTEPLRCPQRGCSSRLGTARRRECGPPRLRPRWPTRPLRCPQRGRSSRLGTARRRSPLPHTRDRARQLREPSVEEVPAAGKGEDRQVLRPCPGQHVAERDNVVFLAVNDNRVRGHGRGCEARNCRCDQHHPFRR